MKKITILLNVLFFIAIKCNAGSFIDGYRSIGYWIGGGASLVAEEGAYERHNSMGDVYYSFNQRIFNYKENTVTKIVSNYGEDLKIENTKNGEAKINKWSLLKSVGITVSGPSKSNVEVYVLPNDNILYMVELEQTIIKGSIKLQDRVESVYGFPFVIEGATVPLKETDVKSWGFILDSKSKYKVLNAFPVPAHADCISSVNGRFYFMSDYYEKGCNMGYQTIHCYDFNGTCLWRYHNYSRQEWFGTFQETLDNIYLACSEKADDGEFYGIIRVLNVKDGNTVNAMRGKGKNGAYFIYINYFKDGFEWGYDRCKREDGGRLKYIKEDASFKAQIEKEWDEMVSNMQQRASKKTVLENEASPNLDDTALQVMALSWQLREKLEKGDIEAAKPIAESLYNKLKSSNSNKEKNLETEMVGYIHLASFYESTKDNANIQSCIQKAINIAQKILKINPNNSTAKSVINDLNN